MSKFVSFSVTDGGVVGKARKRLRGDNNRKPEVKKCDQNGGSSFPFWTCVCNYLHNVPSTQQLSTYLYNHEPKRLTWPSQGSGASAYVGSTIFLKYFRFKGYAFSKPNNPVQVRWRLCLIRIDWSGIDSTTFNTSSYLNLFKAGTVSPVAAMNSFDKTVEGSAVNYYAKQKDVEEWPGIKRVVIASGVLPPSTQYHTLYGPVTLPTNQIDSYNVSSTNNIGYAETAGYRGYTPIDVKVTLNDRVVVQKDLVRYYLIFESDCGLGYPWQSAIDGTGGDLRLIPRVDWPSESPIQIRIQGTTYYTDA